MPPWLLPPAVHEARVADHGRAVRQAVKDLAPGDGSVAEYLAERGALPVEVLALWQHHQVSDLPVEAVEVEEHVDVQLGAVEHGRPEHVVLVPRRRPDARVLPRRVDVVHAAVDAAVAVLSHELLHLLDDRWPAAERPELAEAGDEAVRPVAAADRVLRAGVHQLVHARHQLGVEAVRHDSRQRDVAVQQEMVHLRLGQRRARLRHDDAVEVGRCLCPVVRTRRRGGAASAALRGGESLDGCRAPTGLGGFAAAAAAEHWRGSCRLVSAAAGGRRAAEGGGDVGEPAARAHFRSRAAGRL